MPAACRARTREFLQAAAGRQQADAGFDQADIAFECATVRAECIWNSQPPPSAMPRTAATTGTSAYLMRMLVCLEVARPSLRSSSNLPALQQASAPQVGAGRERLASVCQITRP